MSSLLSVLPTPVVCKSIEGKETITPTCAGQIQNILIEKSAGYMSLQSQSVFFY